MLSRSVRILAPAKVNLFLGVHSELDERRYHLADSLMACVDVADVVTLQDSCELTVRCVPDLGIPQEKNTCWKAAQAMGKAFGREPQFEIVVEKHVPDQAGLGGGSSDAAATIVGICELWGIDPQGPRCFAAARSVGADVAFFLSGLPTFLQGAGDEVVEVLPAIQGAHLVLVKPAAHGEGVSTVAAYQEFDRDPVPAGDPTGIRAALRREGWPVVIPLMQNNLEPVAMRLDPSVGKLRRWLSAQPGVLRAMVTGSGSCVFAACESAHAAEAIAQAAREQGMWAHSGSFLGHGPQMLS